MMLTRFPQFAVQDTHQCTEQDEILCVPNSGHVDGTMRI